MKKILGILIVLLTIVAVAGCGSSAKEKPSEPVKHPAPAAAPVVKSYPPQIIEHKGTAFGVEPPKWVNAAIEGTKAVEKLPDFANKYIVIVTEEGGDLKGVQLAAEKIEAQTRLASLISTRVKDTFAGAQVGDKDKLDTYMERCVKSVAEAKFSGFAMDSDWWVKLQNFTSDGKADKQDYRVIQIWTIDKDTLQKQLSAILKDSANQEAKTPEKQRAMDLVQQSFFDGF